MKNASKLACVLGCALLAGAFSVVMMNITSGLTIDTGVANKSHNIKLKELHLAGNGWDAIVSVSDENLSIQNGLVVYSNTVAVWSNAQMVFIGWWEANKIKSQANNLWIVWWKDNTIGYDGKVDSTYNSVIGWWVKNTVLWTNGAIWWGKDNTANIGGVILGWEGNDASDRSVILWWKSNVSWNYSLVLWSGAKWWSSSFVWNDWTEDMLGANSDSAYIGADGGVLIWTYTAKDGVKLVVDGAVKLEWKDLENSVWWEIIEKDGCFYTHDGGKWHVMGIDSESKGNCNISELAKTCKFGNVKLQEGDMVEAYESPYAENCEAIKKEVTCEWQDLTDYYPYCYQISKFVVENSNLQWAGDGRKLKWDNPFINNHFTWEDLIIKMGGLIYTIMDRNLWAISDDINSPDSYGYHYQWWNNYGFSDEPATMSSAKVVRGFVDWYSNSTWITVSPWNSDASISDIWTQWPCPEWYHVPSASEWKSLYDSFSAWKNTEEWQSFCNGLSVPNCFAATFKLPFAPALYFGGDINTYKGWDYRSSTTYSLNGVEYARNLYFNGSKVFDINTNYGHRSNGYAIRCFKGDLGSSVIFEDVKEFNVTFNPNWGQLVSPAVQTIREWGKATRPLNPYLEGYDFDDWYTDNETFQNKFDFDTSITADITLYAKWNGLTCGDLEWFDSNNNHFCWNDLTIWGVTLMDRNLGATSLDVEDSNSYWYYYKWWNNYWYSAQQPSWAASASIWDWSEWDEWPCPDWYHIPTSSEWVDMKDAWCSSRGYDSYCFTHYLEFQQWANLPYAGYIQKGKLEHANDGEHVGWYYSSSPGYYGWTATFSVYDMSVGSSDKIDPELYPVRCFKDLTSEENVTITFETNGWSAVNAQTIKKWWKVTQPIDPKKGYYMFEWWYTDVALATKFNFATAVNDNITLYAKWSSDLKVWDYILQDKNLWATKVYNGDSDAATYGDCFKWWRSSPYLGDNNVWVWVEYAQWPCPTGYHVSTKDEWEGVYDKWCSDYPTECSSSHKAYSFALEIKLPFAGYVYPWNIGYYNGAGSLWYYNTSSNGYVFRWNSSQRYIDNDSGGQYYAYPVRCFRDDDTARVTVRFQTNGLDCVGLSTIVMPKWSKIPVPSCYDNVSWWYKDNSFQDEFDFSTSIVDDIVLYARGDLSILYDKYYETISIWKYTIADKNVWASETFNWDFENQNKTSFWEYYTWWGVNGFWNEGDQWPCPTGYHVPTKDEWNWIYNIWKTCSNRTSGKWLESYNFAYDLKLPFAGYNDMWYGVMWRYWSSSFREWLDYGYDLWLKNVNQSSVDYEDAFPTYQKLTVRCFKNS